MGSTTQGRGIVRAVGTGGRRHNSGTVIFRDPHPSTHLHHDVNAGETPIETKLAPGFHFRPGRAVDALAYDQFTGSINASGKRA
jgi:hypothetical protein